MKLSEKTINSIQLRIGTLSETINDHKEAIREAYIDVSPLDFIIKFHMRGIEHSEAMIELLEKRLAA